MPIYEYQCAACDSAMEKLQKISDPPLVDCPECGKPELRKLVSAAGFRLKGAGWYETDFKSGGRKNLAEGSNKNGTSRSDTKTKDKPSAESKKSDSGKSASSDQSGSNNATA